MSSPAVYVIVFDVVAGLALVLLSFALRRFIWAGRPAHPEGERNLAESLVAAADLLATFLVVAAVLSGSVAGQDVLEDLRWTALFGATGVVLLTLAGRLGARLVLGDLLAAEIARGNVAAGIAAAAHWLAAGLLVSSCIYGRDLATFGVSLAFFALAQITLHLFVVAFRALTVYGDREEILGENVAAALSYAGATVALGVVIGHAAEGVFEGLAASLRGYAVSLAGSLVLYPVRQLVVGALLSGGGLVLRGGRLDAGIARERNVGLGVLEASAYLAAALAWVRLT
jgi:uncharacterized membrane protein YjfL (UPF0719 family)